MTPPFMLVFVQNTRLILSILYFQAKVMEISTSRLVYIILSPVFSTLMVLLNIPSMLIFVQKMRLASFSLIILTNICACDVFVSLFSNNFYIFNITSPPNVWRTGPFACKIFKTVTMLTNVSQILSLSVLCQDRVRRLTTLPLTQWKIKQGLVSLCGIWSFSILLTIPRVFLFQEKQILRFSHQMNSTCIEVHSCKPIDLNSPQYIICTSLLFVFGYACPSIHIISVLIRSKLVGYKHQQMMRSVTNGNMMSQVQNMSQQLSMTFNLLGLLYVVIWTPFFVMSLLDLQMPLLINRNFMDLNFTLRCTLLVLGSGKPLIYLVYLPKFRQELCRLLTKTKPSIGRYVTKEYSISKSTGVKETTTANSGVSVAQ